MHKWEYLKIFVTYPIIVALVATNKITGDEEVWKYINSLGQDGWELELISKMVRIGHTPGWSVTHGLER